MEEAPFAVTEEYQLGNLTEVKEDRVVLPVQSAARFRIQNAAARTSKDGSIKSISLELRLVDGIDVGGETKYQNKPMFVDVIYWVDTNVRSSKWWTSPNKPYLLPLKQLLTALEYPLDAPPKLNDQFYSEIKGREVRADITVDPVQVKDPVTMKYVDVPGEFTNKIKKFTAA